MEIIKQKLEILAKQLNLTKSDDEPEEYILTAEEEQTAINYAITRAKEDYQRKHLEKGERLIDVNIKISEIDWIEKIEKDSLLKNCNSNKQYDLWLKKKNQEEKQQEQNRLIELKQRHTAKFIYNIMAWTSLKVFNKTLIVNSDNKKFITTICFFLSGDERFETELGYSFKKGLLVRGISGLGKTFLFQCVKDNQLLPITIYSMIDIAETVQEQGYLELPKTTGIIYLDDVGTEESVVKHYGTNINFFKNFIEKYYLNNSQFNRLIISTNDNFDKIEEKYGFRVRSRMKDIFNIINVTGTDMRGN